MASLGQLALKGGTTLNQLPIGLHVKILNFSGRYEAYWATFWMLFWYQSIQNRWKFNICFNVWVVVGIGFSVYTSLGNKWDSCSSVSEIWFFTESRVELICLILQPTDWCWVLSKFFPLLDLCTVYDMCHFIKIIFIFSKILLFFPKYFYFFQNNFIFSKFFLILSNYFHFFQTILIFSKLFKYISFWFPPKYPLDFCQKEFYFCQKIHLIFTKKNFIFPKNPPDFSPK